MAAIPASPGRRDGEVRCRTRVNGQGCAGVAYRLQPATTALLDQVRRLLGHPWTVERELLLSGPDAQQAQEVEHTLRAKQAQLDQASERILLMHAVTAPQQAAFDRVRARLSAEITDLEHQLAVLQDAAKETPRLRRLHEKLTRTSVGGLVDTLVAQDDPAGLRDLIVTLVDHATVVERYPSTRSWWMRCQVTWSADVYKLLQAGLLTLGPEPERPARGPARRRTTTTA
jgi:hypothetical protein